jgi:peptidoglycan hydrolase-like protein with peptidoglycan-binding domain
MSWRLAKSLETLRAQINTRYPRRDRKSDGTIGDAAHSSRTSDHNPDSKGRVCAFDITRDEANGPDLAKMIPLLLADKRTKYVIYDKRIYNPSINGGAARPYNGANAHKQHLHLSVNQAGADDTASWILPGAPLATSVEKPPVPEPKPRTTLKKGMTGGDVPVLQLRLRELGYYSGLVDGSFGPKTEAALKTFQTKAKLKADGVAGPLTWQALGGSPPSNQEPSGRPEPTSGLPEAIPEQTTNKTIPQHAIEYFESLGWSRLAAVALTANLMWESGGNAKGTIITTAIGDAGKSHGAGQWNGSRYVALLEFAENKGKSSADLETQLAFVDFEMRTTERRAGTALRTAATIEEAVAAAITYWRPSIPHADKRLAIAQKLL